MFLDWRNQYCENDFTTQSNLKIQCNPYQITYGILNRTRAKIFTICMDIQKAPDSPSDLEKEKWSWRSQSSWRHPILQSYSHQDTMILAQTEYRSMEQNREPRDKWWRRKWQPTPVFSPGESRGQRGLVGCCPQSCTWLKRLSMHACIGEGNGNPLQYSFLENPRDRGAGSVAIYGVTQSPTQLKQLSRSSSRDKSIHLWTP